MKIIRIFGKILLSAFLISIPVILLFIAIPLLTEQSHHLLMKKLTNADLFPELYPLNVLKLSTGIISLLLALVIPIYLHKKNLSLYGWYVSLFLNGLALFILFVYLTTPLLDFFIIRGTFAKGFCEYIDRSREYNKKYLVQNGDFNEQEWNNTQIKINEFCEEVHEVFSLPKP
jgi:multisubunit Na+/H+ antiporter MnhG subunit